MKTKKELQELIDEMEYLEKRLISVRHRTYTLRNDIIDTRRKLRRVQWLLDGNEKTWRGAI